MSRPRPPRLNHRAATCLDVAELESEWPMDTAGISTPSAIWVTLAMGDEATDAATAMATSGTIIRPSR